MPRTEGLRRVGVPHRGSEARDRVRRGIQDRQHVGRVLRRAVEWAVGVDPRIATIRGDQIVKILLRVAPLPRGHDDVTLDALRSRRRAVRQLAPRDAIGPVAVVLERCAPEALGERGQHERGGLSRLHPANPRAFSGIERAKRRGDGARGELPQLVTADAGAILHHGEPVALGDVRRDVALAAELTSLRDLEHRVPVDRRIVLRRGCSVRRRHRPEVQRLAEIAVDLG